MWAWPATPSIFWATLIHSEVTDAMASSEVMRETHVLETDKDHEAAGWPLAGAALSEAVQTAGQLSWCRR